MLHSFALRCNRENIQQITRERKTLSNPQEANAAFVFADTLERFIRFSVSWSLVF